MLLQKSNITISLLPMSLKIYTANKATKNRTARNIVIFFGMCFLKRYTVAAGGSARTIG